METGDARQAAPSRGEGPNFTWDLGLLAGGSAVVGPLGLLAAEEERLAADRHRTTAEEAGA
jgi:hypothetical protein